MPRICHFFGIVISMYYDDHAPPHFHVHYAEYRAAITIESLEIRDGQLPGRALGLVLEWATAHRHELRSNWENARRGLPLKPIEPLE